MNKLIFSLLTLIAFSALCMEKEKQENTTLEDLQKTCATQCTKEHNQNLEDFNKCLNACLKTTNQSKTTAKNSSFGTLSYVFIMNPYGGCSVSAR